MRKQNVSSLQAIQHSPMHEVVYDRLREALSSGEMTPGQRLVIRDLADTLGTSVMPVREALRRLEAENAVEAIGGRTLSVPLLTADEYEELGLIRTELEGRAAYHAALRITPEEIDEAEKYANLADQAALDDDGAAIAVYNRQFHSVVNRASRLPLLLRMIESLWLRVGPQITHALKTGMVSEWGRDMKSLFHPHHRAIAAFRNKDAPAARMAIAYDIDCAASLVVAHMREQESAQQAEAKKSVKSRKKKKSKEALQV